jgi:hypothetical protein
MTGQAGLNLRKNFAGMSFAGSGIDNKLGTHKHLPTIIEASGRKFNTKTPNIKSPSP